jgi:Lamin Tail Domain
MIGKIKLWDYKNHHFFFLIRYFLLFILLFSFKLEGQYRFDFEIDSLNVEMKCPCSQWKQLPAGRWCCDSLEAIEGGGSLHHCFDNPEQGCDCLVLRHDPINMSDSFLLSFRIRHGFAPSSQNNWQLAVSAEYGQEGEELQITTGIVVGVNFQGSDDMVKIWGVQEGMIEEWCVSSLNYQEELGTDDAPLFNLEWDGAGQLRLFVSDDPENKSPELIGSCRPEHMPRGRALVLRYRYSSSRDRALWLDRLILDGNFEKDTLSPVVREAEVEAGHCIRVGFSERILKPAPAMFTLYGEGFSQGIFPDSLEEQEQGVLISFLKDIPNRLPCQLHVGGVEDLEGNFLRDTILNLMRNDAEWGDLVFNELLFDPDPALHYDTEYLELFNRSAYLLNLEGWQLRVNERNYELVSYLAKLNASMDPGAYALVQGLTLPNEGAVLSLYSSEEKLIHAARYRVPWDGDDWKKEGGWSLESPDANELCTVSSNWEYSSDPSGGTPGRTNSMQVDLLDQEAPVLLFAGLGNPGECLLHYSETVALSAGQETEFSLDPEGLEPEWVEALEPLSEILCLRFAKDFQLWHSFRLSVPGVKDCMGNGSVQTELRAGAVSQALYGSVLINEIMYDPEEGKPEYVELYLPGEKFYDLQDLSIHLVKEGGSPESPVALSSCSRLILPGQYLVLTKSVAHLVDAYGLQLSGQWVEVEELPALYNSSGSIYLTDRAAQVVDMAVYREEMHMELLDDPRGISLERIACDRSGTDPDNWHSAASIEGYATPGRKNSQAAGEHESKDLLTVMPEVFSPDGDGYQDLLEILISPGGQDWVVGVWITDLHGNQIRVLANNHIAGPSVSYTWDGEGENGSIQSMGFYVVHVRAYHPETGEQWVRRKALGLVYR